MAVARSIETQRAPPEVPRLENGDRLDQPTFHERYLAMPANARAELIGGIVYLMTSPVSRTHGRFHATLDWWLSEYARSTPAVEGLDNTTVILGVFTEPQPDLALRRLPDHGGGSEVREDDYVEGSPELVVEVSTSSAAYDLNQKKADYEQAAVQEYIVVLPHEREVRWFSLVNGQYQPINSGDDGVFKSEVFPGLWLDSQALFEGGDLREALKDGLATENQ